MHQAWQLTVAHESLGFSRIFSAEGGRRLSLHYRSRAPAVVFKVIRLNSWRKRLRRSPLSVLTGGAQSILSQSREA